MITSDLIEKNKKTSLVLLILSLLVFSFWVLSRIVNVYHFAIGGAIFEILWLPMIALTFILPLLSFLNWKKEKFALRSFNLISIIISISVILLVVFEV